MRSERSTVLEFVVKPWATRKGRFVRTFSLDALGSGELPLVVSSRMMG